MKKIVALIIAIVLLMSLVSCGNKSYGLGGFTFRKVHITTRTTDTCVEIKKWYEAATGIEVEMSNGEHLWLSEGTYILVEDACPVCGGD